MGRYVGLLGIVAILALAILISTNRKAINLRIVGAAFALQAAIAVFVIYSDVGQAIILRMSSGVQNVMNYSREGIEFIFGGLATEPTLFSFAINVLPVIIFFSALMSVLYHIGVMQFFVRIIGGALRWVIGTRPVESMNAAANIFIGQTEAPLVVRPYLPRLTDAQMFTVMVSGVASVAGTVLIAYSQMGAELRYLLAASFMAAPGGLLMAKLIMPDEDDSSGASEGQSLRMGKSGHENVFLAAAVGASDGLRLAVNIGGMLIAFVALIALFNGIVGGVAGWFGHGDLTLQSILGWLFAPVMYLTSVPWAEAKAAGALFGEKLILNEFVAYSNLDAYLAGASERTRAIVTFALCGFANVSSIAILLGGLGGLVPEKKELIARLGVRAVAAGSLSNLMSATLAGLLLTV
ncbi:MAG: NupC/NupG family nucleoside CNT transporter [Pseudomonadota bacterium]